ncbi:hypothetical protein CBL_09473 [Carabus blaptoides fortunei]
MKRHQIIRMTTWKTEEEFVQDRKLLSEFYYIDDGPEKKFTFKSSKPEAEKIKSFYFDSDSDEEILDLDTEPTSKEEVFDNIRRQVRNAFGCRYSNEAIETYYNVERNTRKEENETAKGIVASLSKDTTMEYPYLNNNMPTKPVNSTRCSVAANIENSTKTQFFAIFFWFLQIKNTIS